MTMARLIAAVAALLLAAPVRDSQSGLHAIEPPGAWAVVTAKEPNRGPV